MKLIKYLKITIFYLYEEMIDELDNMDIIYNNNELPIKIKKCCSVQKGSWPLKTNIWCWWCMHSFDTVPCPVIRRYNNKTDTLHVEGMFCSWNCAKAYIIKNKKSHITAMGLQTLLYQKFQKKTSRIKASPPVYCLKEFGGNIDIEEYRRKYATHTCKQEEVKNNLSEVRIDQVNEDPDYSYNTVFGFVNTEDKQVEGHGHETANLKLKRSKPIKSKGTLQQTMGLIIS